MRQTWKAGKLSGGLLGILDAHVGDELLGVRIRHDQIVHEGNPDGLVVEVLFAENSDETNSAPAMIEDPDPRYGRVYSIQVCGTNGHSKRALITLDQVLGMGVCQGWVADAVTKLCKQLLTSGAILPGYLQQYDLVRDGASVLAMYLGDNRLRNAHLGGPTPGVAVLTRRGFPLRMKPGPTGRWSPSTVSPSPSRAATRCRSHTWIRTTGSWTCTTGVMARSGVLPARPRSWAAARTCRAACSSRSAITSSVRWSAAEHRGQHNIYNQLGYHIDSRHRGSPCLFLVVW